MKEYSKYQKKIRICQILASAAAAATGFFLPFPMDGSRTCGVLLFGRMVTEMKFRSEYILLVVYLLLSLLHLLRIFLLIRKKPIGILYRLEPMAFWVGSFTPFMGIMISPTIFQTGGIILYIPVFMTLGVVTFLYCRYQETMEDKEEEFEREREQEKEEQKRRKQAAYFPGRYPKEFYRVIQKMFRSRLKVQVLMMLSEAFSAAGLFIVLSMYRIMKKTYTMESGITGDGLYGLFRSLGMILMALSLVMMVMMTSWYLKEVKKDFRILVILGIRRRTAYAQFLLEFWLGASVAGAAGLGAGAAAASLLRAQLQKGMPEGITLPGTVTGASVGLGLLVYLVLMILSLVLNQEHFLDLGRSVDRNEDLQKEKRLQRWIGLWILGGLFLAMLAVRWYAFREWAESRFIHVLTVGALFLLITGGMAWWLRERKKREAYYAGLTKTNLFYHRFWSNVNRLFFLAVIQFLALGIFAIPLAGAWIPQEIASMYPYDIVVTAYESELPKLQETAEKYEAHVCQYPMLRMTSIYGSDRIKPWTKYTRPVQWPQGQQIAVSESTYQEMREFLGKEPKPLYLKGEEMHVVYQQDRSVKAHTIDWDTGRMEKHLRFGQPLEYYNTDDFRNVFPVRTIKSEERDSLTGMFHQGMQDNLVVLSDAYFQENYDRITAYNRENWETRQSITREEWRHYAIRHPANLTEGPTMLFCMNLDEALVDQAAADLDYLKEEQDFDTVWDSNIQPFYVRSRMITNTESEIFFTKIGNGFILLVLLILGLFQYFVKIKSEEDTWRWENVFLKRLGMKEKDRKRNIRYQMKCFLLLPLLPGLFLEMIFAGLTAKARFFSQMDTLQFAGNLAVVDLIWCLVWGLAYLVLKRNLWKHVEKE